MGWFEKEFMGTKTQPWKQKSPWELDSWNKCLTDCLSCFLWILIRGIQWEVAESLSNSDICVFCSMCNSISCEAKNLYFGVL